jgi:DNA polymerase III subunit beta
MKLLQTYRDALLGPLQAITGIVEKRHTLPILSNVLLRREEQKLFLVTTDLEIQLLTACEAPSKAGEKVSLTVSARKLQDILRALPEDAELQLDVQNNRLQVRAGKTRFNLQTLPAEDFPTLADPGAVLATLRVPQKQFRDLLLLVQYAMGHQDIRYYLNGMLLVLEEEQIKAIATDGHRLSYASETTTLQAEKNEVILPRKAIHELTRLLTDSDQELEIGIFAAQARFRFGEVELITKLIDGKFPDYTRVIPSTYRHHVAVARLQLLQALQRAAILSNDKFRGVRWTLTENVLRVACTNNEQEDAQEELDVEYDGEPLDMGFNVSYLLDILNNVPGEKVDCAFGDANSSMLITLPERQDFRYVVMPMRI